MELFLLRMNEVTMLLTWYAFFDKGVAICLHSWLEVADSEYTGGHGSCARVISAYAFMQFSYYVLGLFRCYSFEKWMTISVFVEVVTYHCIPFGFSHLCKTCEN